MCSFVVKPARIVEFVIGVFVMTNIARRFRFVTWTGRTDTDESTAVGRPRENRDAVCEIGDPARFPPVKRQNPDLILRHLLSSIAGHRPRREKRNESTVWTPSRTC